MALNKSRPDGNSNLLFADTEKLKSTNFWEYAQELQRVLSELKSEIAACLPIAKEERDKSDTEINKSVSDQCKFMTFLLAEIKALSGGDARQVEMLKLLMEDVEEINQVAANIGGSKH